MDYIITVDSLEEGERISAGLEDPAVRAFVVVSGVLSALPTDRARERVLSYFWDRAAEERDNTAKGPTC